MRFRPLSATTQAMLEQQQLSLLEGIHVKEVSLKWNLAPRSWFLHHQQEALSMSNVSRAGNSPVNNGTSSTHFGNSVESQAQISDAAALGADLGHGEPLNVYRLEPLAADTDPRWKNAPGHGVVLVAARTAGDARIVAAARELDFMEIDAAPAEDVTTSNASAFRDDKLYTVIEVEHGRQDVSRGVLEGNISVATVKPVQV
jgi:hypothetical protein